MRFVTWSQPTLVPRTSRASPARTRSVLASNMAAFLLVAGGADRHVDAGHRGRQHQRLDGHDHPLVPFMAGRVGDLLEEAAIEHPRAKSPGGSEQEFPGKAPARAQGAGDEKASPH